ncbi:hypothetical protein D918_00777 [Trichuris suis]|nr:hypothetical protein D918_00777 [Trichuris suis]
MLACNQRRSSRRTKALYVFCDRRWPKPRKSKVGLQ